MKYQEFQDFDLFAESVRDVDSVMLLHNLKRRIWNIMHIELDGIDVQIGQEGSGNITEGRSRSDGYILFIPFNNAEAHMANGKSLDKNSIAILEPGCDFCIRCTTEHDWCSIFVPTHQIARDSNLIEPSSSSEKMTCRVTRSNPLLVNQFGAFVRSIMNTAANCEQFEYSFAATLAAAELRKVASLVIGQRQAGEPKKEGRPRLPRQEIIQRSKELLEERESKPVQVRELVTAVGVSERTLRTAFNEYFGVGPIKYLQLRQLHQIHRELKKADPEEYTVGKIMVKYGVWEFSRCASRYRQVFGELPSETLRQVS